MKEDKEYVEGLLKVLEAEDIPLDKVIHLDKCEKNNEQLRLIQFTVHVTFISHHSPSCLSISIALIKSTPCCFHFYPCVGTIMLNLV